MISLQVHTHKTADFVTESEIMAFQPEITKQFEALKNKTGKGNDFLGWLNLPTAISQEEIRKIENLATKITDIAEILVVIGIGGSYLGAKAVIDAMSNHFSPLLNKTERRSPLVVFAGQNICADYHADLFEMLAKKEYAVAVISKSGTTTEPALAFRLLKQDLEKRYGKKGASERIIAVTDSSKGALRELANTEGYETFSIPDDVGGRFSVLTAVGLLPIAVAGFDIRKLIEGARNMQIFSASKPTIDANPVARYAAVRNALHQKGKVIEILASYHPRLQYVGEWWKQLYGESEGKSGKGIFPASVNLTSDLHSMGQMIQDGMRNIFETVITVQKTKKQIIVPKDEANLDKLNFLAGKNFTEINQMAQKGTLIAHVEGNVPNILIDIPEISELTIGEMIYFFEKACAVSAYILDVNPFDQPGVEAYKTNMYALLGKAGFESLAEEIRNKL